MRLAFSAACLGFLLTAAPAFAHDHWISLGRYRSPVDGVLCCGQEDCAVVPNTTVRETPAGYELEGGEVIPHAETMPSEDGDFWRCRYADGSRSCFFAPGRGS